MPSTQRHYDAVMAALEVTRIPAPRNTAIIRFWVQEAIDGRPANVSNAATTSFNYAVARPESTPSAWPWPPAPSDQAPGRVAGLLQVEASTGTSRASPGTTRVDTCERKSGLRQVPMGRHQQLTERRGAPI